MTIDAPKVKLLVYSSGQYNTFMEHNDTVGWSVVSLRSTSFTRLKPFFIFDLKKQFYTAEISNISE